METRHLAKLALERGGRWLKSAEAARREERYDDVVYSAQMCVEQSAKAVLLWVGIDYPKEHDVSGVFRQLEGLKSLPRWFRHRVPALARSISELAEQRGMAGYGFESGVTAEYFAPYADRALTQARACFDICGKLLSRLTG